MTRQHSERRTGRTDALVSLPSLPTRLLEALAVFVFGHFLRCHFFAFPIEPPPFDIHRAARCSLSFPTYSTGLPPRHSTRDAGLASFSTAVPCLLPPPSLPLPAYGLTKRHSPLFALGDKVPLFLGVAQDTISGDLLAETLEQALR